MTEHKDKDTAWHPWSEFPEGDLKKQIEANFADGQRGDHIAMQIRIDNPISGYRLLTPHGT